MRYAGNRVNKPGQKNRAKKSGKKEEEPHWIPLQ